MSQDKTTDLIGRLHKHDGGSRQQCACHSQLDNYAACDCGAAADEIEGLREALGYISRMKLFPDHQANMMTLAAAINLAEKALAP